jgi:hypothetical protein
MGQGYTARAYVRGWRRGSRRHPLDSSRAPVYARVAIPVLLALLIGTLVWRGVTPLRRPSKAAASPFASTNVAPTMAVPAWQRDITDSLAESIRNADSGNITAAEVSIDRAESLITAARLQAFDAKAAFFANVNSGLDRVLAQRPQEENLFEHVTEARVSLAELRSATEDDEGSPAAVPAAKENPIRIGAPRQIAPNETLGPRALGGGYLDASLMPDSSEVLLPPTSRSFKDNMQVENITIAGAAQTLDGIRWRNVTFIGTHLRYESGGLDLKNVRFVRCQFGIPSDERGAKLANALALGEASITIDEDASVPSPDSAMPHSYAAPKSSAQQSAVSQRP